MTKDPQRHREEIRTKLKENWDEIAYFDMLYYRTWELINEKEEYFGLSAWDVLDNNFINFERFLRKGIVKDWVGLFREYQRCMKKYKGNQGPFGYQLYEEFLENTLEGLVRSLEQGDIVQKDKLNPFLLEEIKDMLKIDFFGYGAYDFLPERYRNLVEAIGLIGSRKSVPFLKRVIEWVDKHPCEEIGEHGEQKYDRSFNVREAAVEALVRITDDEEAKFLFERFHEDGSPSVQKAIFENLEKMSSAEAKKNVIILRNMIPYHDIDGNYGELHHFPVDKDELLKRDVIVELEKTRKEDDSFDTLFKKAISMSKNKEFAGIDPVKVLEEYFDEL